MRVSGWLYLIQQSLCCLCLLRAMGQTAGLSRRLGWREIVTALLDGGACLGVALTGVSWLRLTALLPVLAVSPMAAYPGLPVRVQRRMAVQGGLLGLLLAGSLRLTAGMGLPGAWGMAAGCLLLPLLPRLMAHTAAAPCTTVAFRWRDNSVSLNAMVDSGNLLRDPVSGLPVIVCARRALRRMVPLNELMLPDAGMRLIRVKTAGGAAMMVLVRPDAVRLRLPDGWREVRAMIGLAPEGYDGCQALVPSCLTDSAHVRDERATLSQGG